MFSLSHAVRRALQNASYFPQYLLLRIAAAVFALLPQGLFYATTRGLCLFTFHVLRILRQVAMDNLRLAFADSQTEVELHAICRDCYFHIGMTMLEMLQVPHMKDRIAAMVEMPDLAILRQALARGRGVILASAHFGSWELAGAAVAAAGFPITVVGARQSNPYIDAYMKRYRVELGMEVVPPHHGSMKPLISALKKREVIGLISDQDAGRQGVFVPFFGRPASTPAGTAQLAIKYQAPVLVALAVRLAPGRYQYRFEEVAISGSDTIETLTARYTAIIEKFIRQHPEQYFWMHRRWKSRPGGFED